MTRPDTDIACNGIVVYQDPQWLRDAKTASILNGTGLAGIADAAGCTTHTIRKWLKNHGLQFTKKEVAQYTVIWNKGASGYSLPKHRAETIEKMRAKARKGAESNLWRGGADRSERLRIADWCYANRSSFLRKADYKCNRCSSTESLELHHVLTVAERPDLAYEPSNIEVLCKPCHDNHHNLSGDYKVWREKSRGNALTVRWSKVKYLKYVGEEMTYDLEVAHASHNYVGNGIVVHNSQRYASVDALPPAPLRDTLPQDTKYRQNSIQVDDAQLKSEWEMRQVAARTAAEDAYQWALD